MKVFLVILFISGIALAHKDHKKSKHGGGKGDSDESRDNQRGGDRKGPPMMPQLPAGCENYKNATVVTAHECCPDLPKLLPNKDKVEDCVMSSRKSGEPPSFCAKIDCIVKVNDLADSTGFIDTKKAAEGLKFIVNGSNYDVQSIVDGCWARAPADAAEGEAMWRNMTQNKTLPNGKKFEECKNTTKVNGAFLKCVKRELIMQCPTWNTTDACTTLMDFAKTCKVYPIHGCGKDEKNGKDNGHDHSHEKGCDKQKKGDKNSDNNGKKSDKQNNGRNDDDKNKNNKQQQNNNGGKGSNDKNDKKNDKQKSNDNNSNNGNKNGKGPNGNNSNNGNQNQNNKQQQNNGKQNNQQQNNKGSNSNDKKGSNANDKNKKGN